MASLDKPKYRAEQTYHQDRQAEQDRERQGFAVFHPGEAQRRYHGDFTHAPPGERDWQCRNQQGNRYQGEAFQRRHFHTHTAR